MPRRQLDAPKPPPLSEEEERRRWEAKLATTPMAQRRTTKQASQMKVTNREIRRALRQQGGVFAAAASVLGLNYSTLIERCDRYTSLRRYAERVRIELDERNHGVAHMAADALNTSALRKASAGHPELITAAERRAMMHFLTKTQLGRDRYADRVEHTGANGAPMQVEATPSRAAVLVAQIFKKQMSATSSNEVIAEHAEESRIE